jgi:malonyl-CoA O-methyltransferase
MTIGKNSDILIFGAGRVGREALAYLRAEGFCVRAFLDNNSVLWGTVVDGITVLPAHAIEKFDNASIVISVAYAEISDQLSSAEFEDYWSYSYFKDIHNRSKKEITLPNLPHNKLAANCLINNIKNGGIAVFAGSENKYPEITGYAIPTLLNYGFRKYALDCAEWLSSVQKENGAFASPHDGREYYFDTAQVLRGFNAIASFTEKYGHCKEKAATFLFSSLTNGFPMQYLNEPNIPEQVQLYALPPMLEYAKFINNFKYVNQIHNAVQVYLHSKNALSTKTLTHFLAYQIDGLIDLGYENEVVAVLHRLAESQDEDGGIPGVAGAQWTCLTGMAQIAICMYKLKMYRPADKIMNYLDAHQEQSGGFLGSIGSDSWYFPDKEILWAVKYYLDAYQLRIAAFFDQHVDMFPADILETDGRYQAIANEVKDGNKIIETGCGKGRFLKMLQKQYHHCSLTGADISEKMLDCVPFGIERVLANTENLSCESNYYDVVFSVEAIEHSVNVRAAVEELARICKPNGKIIIIDKQLSGWGRMECPPWERWPERRTLESLLEEHCSVVQSKIINFDNSDKNDDLMICWMGRKKDKS